MQVLPGAALTRLRDHLDGHAGLIAYERRRRLDYSRLLSENIVATTGGRRRQLVVHTKLRRARDVLHVREDQRVVIGINGNLVAISTGRGRVSAHRNDWNPKDRVVRNPAGADRLSRAFKEASRPKSVTV